MPSWWTYSLALFWGRMVYSWVITSFDRWKLNLVGFTGFFAFIVLFVLLMYFEVPMMLLLVIGFITMGGSHYLINKQSKKIVGEQVELGTITFLEGELTCTSVTGECIQVIPIRGIRRIEFSHRTFKDYTSKHPEPLTTLYKFCLKNGSTFTCEIKQELAHNLIKPGKSSKVTFKDLMEKFVGEGRMYPKKVKPQKFEFAEKELV